VSEDAYPAPGQRELGCAAETCGEPRSNGPERIIGAGAEVQLEGCDMVSRAVRMSQVGASLGLGCSECHGESLAGVSEDLPDGE
jgi:hypothetical protein